MEEALSHFPPESLLVMQAAVAKLSQGQHVEGFEVPLITATGRRILLRIVGEPIQPGEPGEPIRGLFGSIQDVTASRDMEQQMLRTNSLLRSIVDNMPCGLVVYDGDGRLLVHNDQFKRLYEFSNTLFETEDVMVDTLMSDLAAGGDFGPLDVARARIESTKAFIRNPRHQVTQYLRPNGLTIKLQADLLREMSFVDSSTGGHNRRHLDERIAIEEQRAQRGRQGLAVLLADVDYFKKYNDSYGHLAGDDC